MRFFETSKLFSLNRFQYINLRWIAIFGQLITVNIVKLVLEFEFNFIFANLIIFLGILSNIFLIYYYKKNQLPDKLSFIFLCIDIFQLSFLIYLTGGIVNPFSIFIIVPAIFSSIYLSKKTSFLLVSLTIISIVSLTFVNQELPYPLNNHFHVSDYYYFAIPLSLIIALIFLSFFAISFGMHLKSAVFVDAPLLLHSILCHAHEQKLGCYVAIA